MKITSSSSYEVTKASFCISFLSFANKNSGLIMFLGKPLGNILYSIIYLGKIRLQLTQTCFLLSDRSSLIQGNDLTWLTWLNCSGHVDPLHFWDDFASIYFYAPHFFLQSKWVGQYAFDEINPSFWCFSSWSWMSEILFVCLMYPRIICFSTQLTKPFQSFIFYYFYNSFSWARNSSDFFISYSVESRNPKYWS